MAAKAPRKPRVKSSTDTAPARPARRKRAETTDAATATPTPTRAPAPAPAKKPARAAGPTIPQRIATWFAAIQPKPKAKPAAKTPTVEAPKPVETPKRKASVKPIASLRDRAKAKAAATSVAPADQPTATETGAIDANAIQSGTIEAVTTESTLEPMAIEPVAVAPVMTEWTLEPIEVKPDTIDSVATEPALALFEPDIGTIEPVPAEPLVIEHIVEDVIAPVVAGPLAASPVPGEQDVVPRAAEVPVAPIAPAPAAAPVARVERAARPRASSHAPSFARTRGGGLRAIASQGPVSSEWIRAGAVGVLALLLGLQLLLAQSETLAANARWRPTVNALCGVFRCTTPAWRQPEAFTMLSRDVRPHPRAAGTLQIDASFRNDARWPQGWPLLVVSLSDIDGRIVGTRAFSAHEYLGAEVTQNTLGPGQTAAISLAVVEPAPGIVAFSFDFR